jgi:hypothetical protein
MPGTIEDLAPVEVISFGYGHTGADGQPVPPPAAHLTFDVRAHFKDPHVDPALRYLTAADERVQRAVMGTAGVGELIVSMVAAVWAYRMGPSPAPLTVAVGCVGGRHRSAAIAAELVHRLGTIEVPATLTHRDINRPVIRHDQAPERCHKVTHFRWSPETGAVEAACSCGATATDEAGAMGILSHRNDATSETRQI